MKTKDGGLAYQNTGKLAVAEVDSSLCPEGWQCGLCRL
jgi:hypothetical protein